MSWFSVKQKIQIVILILITTLNFCDKDTSETKGINKEIFKIDEEKQSCVKFFLKDKVKVPGVIYPLLTISTIQCYSNL